jgi:hypothetical protein
MVDCACALCRHVHATPCTRAEGLKYGLDFEQALSDPDMVEVVAPTQVRVTRRGEEC